MMDADILFMLGVLLLVVALLAVTLSMNRRDKKEFEEELNKRHENKAHPHRDENETT